MSAPSPSSRYRRLAAYPAPDAAGATHPTLPARPLPPPAPGTPYLHTVVAGETLEALAHRYLSASELWWQIADANPLVFPTDLRAGTVLAIPTGQPSGLITRSRSF